MNYHCLEWELLAGILLMAAGGLVGLSIIWGWAASGFGSLSQIANAVWALALFLAGMQGRLLRYLHEHGAPEPGRRAGVSIAGAGYPCSPAPVLNKIPKR